MNPDKCSLCGEPSVHYFFICDDCKTKPLMERLMALMRWDKIHMTAARKFKADALAKKEKKNVRN